MQLQVLLSPLSQGLEIRLPEYYIPCVMRFCVCTPLAQQLPQRSSTTTEGSGSKLQNIVLKQRIRYKLLKSNKRWCQACSPLTQGRGLTILLWAVRSQTSDIQECLQLSDTVACTLGVATQSVWLLMNKLNHAATNVGCADRLLCPSSGCLQPTTNSLWSTQHQACMVFLDVKLKLLVQKRSSWSVYRPYQITVAEVVPNALCCTFTTREVQ